MAVMSRTPGERIFNIINLFLLGSFALVAIYPFIYTVSISLSTQSEAARGGLHLYPREVSLTSFKMVFQNPDIIVGYLNTIFRTVVGTALHVFFVCLTAYPLARRELPHRSLLIFLVLFTMIFNGGLVPMFLVINGVGLYNSRWVYIVPLLLTAFNVIIVKNFFQQIPESFAESARIDGASEFRIMWEIFLPLSKPVLATIILWTAVIHWNHWFDALLYIDDNNKQVMQILLRRIVIENSTELIEKGLVNPDLAQFTPETIKAATTIITILPILLFYPFVQKYFVKGIMIGGIKG